MSIIWADSFDYYGTTPNDGRDAMVAGLWTQADVASTGSGISTAQARTGTSSLRVNAASLAISAINFRRGFGGAKTTIGLAFGQYFSQLPSVDDRIVIQLRDGSNNNLVSFCFQSDGSIDVKTGAHDGSLIGSTAQVIAAGTFNHIEIKTHFSSSVGTVDIYVNSTLALALTGQNLGATGASQVKIGTSANTATGAVVYYDDLIAWDTAGSVNNDVLGPMRVLTVFPTADTAEADWSKTGDTDGFDCIDNVPPDGDTTYLAASTAGDISEFTFSALPSDIADIAAIVIPTMAKLASAGVGNVQTSLISNGDAAVGADTALTTTYTYHADVIEANPDTLAPWTKSEFEAAILRLEKTV